MSEGRAVADVLAGAWRGSPPRLQIDGERLTAIAPLLVASGAGALGWWRLRSSCEQMPGAASEFLRQSYLEYAILAAQQERELTEVFRLLRADGIEPILLKGWAVGRLYPEAGLRPSGDMDICVAPEHYEVAQAVLNRPENEKYWVDLDHNEVTRFRERSWQELFSRSQRVALDSAEVRVLGAEDQLFTLCVHFLRHGGWRPLWLCDIAAALESRPPGFDWDYCLGTNARLGKGVLCTITLAHCLLGAELGDAPAMADLPAWLPSALLKRWNEPPLSFLPRIRNDFERHWRRPGILLKHFAKRWPNPIQATVDADAEFDHAPRLPLQIRYCLTRTRKIFQQGPE